MPHCGHGEGSEMNTRETLMKLMEESDNEDIREACLEAVNALELVPILKNKLRYAVPVPCRVGDILYSIIGDKVTPYVIDGYRIEKDEIYMTSQDVFLRASQIGKYYFLSEPVAKLAHKKMYRGEKTG